MRNIHTYVLTEFRYKGFIFILPESKLEQTRLAVKLCDKMSQNLNSDSVCHQSSGATSRKQFNNQLLLSATSNCKALGTGK